jgi:hypothetical protein
LSPAFLSDVFFSVDPLVAFFAIFDRAEISGPSGTYSSCGDYSLSLPECDRGTWIDSP